MFLSSHFNQGWWILESRSFIKTFAAVIIGKRTKITILFFKVIQDYIIKKTIFSCFTERPSRLWSDSIPPFRSSTPSFSDITPNICEVFLSLNAPGTDQYKYVKQVWENSSIDINRTQHLISTSETQSLALNTADLNAQRAADKKRDFLLVAHFLWSLGWLLIQQNLWFIVGGKIIINFTVVYILFNQTYLIK